MRKGLAVAHGFAMSVESMNVKSEDVTPTGDEELVRQNRHRERRINAAGFRAGGVEPRDSLE